MPDRVWVGQGGQGGQGGAQHHQHQQVAHRWRGGGRLVRRCKMVWIAQRFGGNWFLILIPICNILKAIQGDCCYFSSNQLYLCQDEHLNLILKPGFRHLYLFIPIYIYLFIPI